MDLVRRGVLCTLYKVYEQYVDVNAVVVAVARIIASLSVHTDFHADIFAAGTSASSMPQCKLEISA